MELNGSKVIAQTKEIVWAALNNEAILQQCITGCESMQRIDGNSLSARLAIKLGPVRAKFNGQVTMSNIQPLQGYTLTFEGSGGAAGFAKGASNVELNTVDNGTQVSYTVNASVGGKLGQIGGRMIDAAAKAMADDFFAAFAKILEKDEGPAMAGDAQLSHDDALGSNKAIVLPTTIAGPNAGGVGGHIESTKAVRVANEVGRDTRLFWFCAGIACGAALLLIGKNFL
jgi:uncharacterized protein